MAKSEGDEEDPSPAQACLVDGGEALRRRSPEALSWGGQGQGTESRMSLRFLA